ncbi:MAG: polymerase III, gamma/tau subunit protein [Microgenomates group bacterium GW2011_GWA2_39_19]|nr:MAG: polymerase III, gamma/tau subunit protein [Microgenomates group bacterium GW2011_GWA2_39_19]HBL51898.1 hypothetical protein [Candidatus Blackburnbacteria bacterium]
MHAFLITGNNAEKRNEKIEELTKQFSASETIVLESYLIESVRALRKKLTFSSKDIRAVIITNVHLLTLEAANAFLKTLEEPPSNTIIIMTAPNPDIVLETIVSRAQIIDLGNSTPLQDEVKATSLFDTLSMSTGQRLCLLEEIGEREKAIEFCTQQIMAARQYTIVDMQQRDKGTKGQSVKGNLTISQLLSLIEKIEQTRKDLESNVNVKMALGDLLLNYPHY